MRFRPLIGLLACVAYGSAAQALTTDELQLLQRVRAVAAAPVDDFRCLGSSNAVPDGLYRYQLAFLSYGLCSVVSSDPALRPEARHLFTRLVEKMEYPTTLAYWHALGYPETALDRDNAMYRGHLNLMYALAHDRFGETRFDVRFHALSRTLFDEVAGEHPVCCEPGQLFIQCNSVIVLSLFLHDRSFDTHYEAAGQHLLDWARQHMPLDGTSLFRDDFRLATGRSSAARSAAANAWTIAFLAPLPDLQSQVKTMYADWRHLFVDPAPTNQVSSPAPPRRLDELLVASLPPMSFGWLAAVRGAPAGEKLGPEESLASSFLATTLGLLATRAEGDESLRRRFERTVACAELLIPTFENWLPARRRVQADAFRNIALVARTFRGWNEVLGIPP